MTEIITDLPPLTELENRWKRLETKSNCSFFLSWTWISSWLSIIKRDNLYLFSAVKNNEEWALAIIKCGKPNGRIWKPKSIWLHQTGISKEDIPYIEYNNILSIRYLEQQAIERLLITIDKHKLTTGKKIFLSGACTELNILNLGKYKILKQNSVAVPYVELSKVRKSKGHLKLVSQNTRYQINRCSKLYLQNGENIQINFVNNLNEALVWLQDMTQLQINHFKKKGKSSVLKQAIFQNFLYHLLNDGLTNNSIDLLQFSNSTKNIGYLLNFNYRNNIFNYQSAFNFNNNNNHLKPGYLCHHKAIEYYSKKNFTTYNFLAGDARYKKSLATETDELHWITLKKK